MSEDTVTITVRRDDVRMALAFVEWYPTVMPGWLSRFVTAAKEALK